MRPLAVDLYTGLHGWAEGLIAAGWRVIGYDIEDMSAVVGEPLPEEHFELVLQDVLTINGADLVAANPDLALIVGSSPCQEFSYRAMPWKRAKALGPPELGLALFHAQFRIQREASEAAGRPIPLVVENVRGAQPWVGRARANFGSYYLWGDVPALMPITASRKVPSLHGSSRTAVGLGNRFTSYSPTEHIKNDGGSWFNIGSPGQKVTNRNPVHDHMKAPAGTKWFNDGPRTPDSLASSGSKSPARKAASAKIAKIPFPLAHWIGKTWLPRAEVA